MKLKIKKLDENAFVPSFQTEGACGFDLTSVEEQLIKPTQTVLVHTGIAMELDYDKDDMENDDMKMRVSALILPRSGLASKKGLAPINTPGLVDEDYRGEVMVALHNHSKFDQYVGKGDRIAQMILLPCFVPDIVEVSELTETIRGEGGFGSTGK